MAIITSPSAQGGASRCCDCPLMVRKIEKICKKCCPSGKDGITPHIGENGNWWIGEEDTGIHAQGEPGEQGPAGSAGERGQKGPKGDKGDPGGANIVGLQMQCYQHKEEVIEKNQYVPFDFTIFDNSAGAITYDKDQRAFHLNELGIYKIDYQIAYDGTSVYGDACFTLVFNNSWQVTNCSSGPTGQVSATALLNCDSPGGVLYITPFGQDISLGNVEFQANITIIKIG